MCNTQTSNKHWSSWLGMWFHFLPILSGRCRRRRFYKRKQPHLDGARCLSISQCSVVLASKNERKLARSTTPFPRDQQVKVTDVVVEVAPYKTQARLRRRSGHVSTWPGARVLLRSTAANTRKKNKVGRTAISVSARAGLQAE